MPSSVTTANPRQTNHDTLHEPDQLRLFVPGISEDRIVQATVVAESFEFRLPAFYAERVLSGLPDDPLLDLVLPSQDELLDGPEEWDAADHEFRASTSPFWVQKYPHEGLLRLTTHCSGFCRFCYLKRKNARTRVMRPEDVDIVFDELERNGELLYDIILSGGDPLCAPPQTLARVSERVRRLRQDLGTATPFITIHTREPVWNPEEILGNDRLWGTLEELAPTFYMVNVIHEREVTPEFLQVCDRLGRVAGPRKQAGLFCQHPVFRGVNDTAEALENLYRSLLAGSTPIIPYYMVFPFYNGTLTKHRVGLEHIQSIYRELIRRPGMFAPTLVVPTPRGKCILGPNEPIIVENNAYRLTTKNGEVVWLPK